MFVKEPRLTIAVVNSFVGVSLLTLPFCFQQCGIILGSLLLVSCSWMTHSSSLMLLKAAVAANRKTYFGLAQTSYGIPGKLVVEISMIGLMLGTSIAFFAVLEDLGTNLFLALTGSLSTPWQRALVLLAITSGVVLPLSLARKVSDSTWQMLISLMFYVLLMIVLLLYCLNSMISGELVMEKVRFWQWPGIATTLPIFATSFCGHPLVLPMYFNLRGQSVEQMNVICKQATITTFAFYTVVGVCGYLTLVEAVPGDILAALPPSFATHGTRAIFLISLTLSFPLVILPCRQAISTLLFEQEKEDGTFSVSGDMPLCQHVITTMVIVYGTMIMGILVPDVQTVLAIIGTTMGTVICFICPSVFHAKLRKDTFTGRIVLGFGILLLLIRASSITDLNGEELQLQPIRKSRVPDESGNAKIALRSGVFKGNAWVFLYEESAFQPELDELILPELMNDVRDKQMKRKGRMLTYKQVTLSTGVNKENTSTKEITQLHEGGLPSTHSTGARLKELKKAKRTFIPVSENRRETKIFKLPTARTHTDGPSGG